MKLEVGDRIFYQKNGEFYVDRIADILYTKEGTLYELVDYDWWCVTEDELLDESDERVRDYICLEKDAMVKLSDVRHLLEKIADIFVISGYNVRDDFYIKDSITVFPKSYGDTIRKGVLIRFDENKDFTCFEEKNICLKHANNFDNVINTTFETIC